MTDTSIQALEAALPRLPSKDLSFANSLIAQAGRRGLSEKQRYWVGKLVEKANKPEPKAVNIGDFAGIKALFDRAAQHLKKPAVVLSIEGASSIKIKPAGGNTRYPGQLHVTEAGKPYGEATYFGRITQEGTYIARTVDPAVEAVLTQFAKDPAGIASLHGRLNGSCCFCNRALEDERSTAVGYGPICAGHYGLPWGAK